MKATGFRRRLLSVTVVAGLLAAVCFPGSGLAGNSEQLPAGKGTQNVFVELSTAPAADITVLDEKAQVSAIKSEQADFRKAAAAAGLKVQERFAYNKLYNGISMTVPVADLPKLARLPGVQNIFPVVSVELPHDQSSGEMIKAPEVVADGYDGTGVKVAVIDTGIDYTHPDLGGCFGIGCRVAKGYDFVGKKSL